MRCVTGIDKELSGVIVGAKIVYVSHTENGDDFLLLDNGIQILFSGPLAVYDGNNPKDLPTLYVEK
jgi:hypothetical protein